MAKISSRFLGFIGRPLYRTLRVDILTLFLSLFIVSFAFVIFFNHFKQIKTIEAFSLGTVERASSIILERVKAIILDANRYPIIADSVIWDENDISENNQNLVLFLLRIVQLESNFSHIFTASLTGNLLTVNDLSMSSQRYLITRPSEPLPKEARFSVLWVDSSVEPHRNVWHYFDNGLHEICYEESFGNEYDPRHRPWFEEVLKSHAVYWSNAFTFLATGDKGISVSQPLYDKEGHMIGVAGVELSFTLLSEFLSQQQVGYTGQAFLLHSNGEELVKHSAKETEPFHKTINDATLAEAYRKYSLNHEGTFHFASQGVEYLAYFNTVPLVTGRHWLIVIIVPTSDFFATIFHTEEIISLFTFAVLVLSGILVFYFSKRLSSPIVTLSKEVDKMKHLELGSEVRVKSNIREIILLDASIASMRNGLRSFAKYVPRKIVKQLIEKGEEISLGGEKKEITIFFSDIAGFTSFSEAHSTDIVMDFLSAYFDALSKIILKEEGTIDKYIGDSIMAFWGAPVEIPDHAIRACRAALLCQAFLAKFNQKRKEEGKPELSTRMVINTGSVIVGNIGTQERMNYTVIGDVINAAAHLQQVNKLYHLKTVITEYTLSQTGDLFLTRPIDILAPTGKKTKIKVFELVALKEGEPDIVATEAQRELCDLSTKAFEAFIQGKLQEAKALFTMIQKKFPEDCVAQIYLEKL